LPWWTVELYIPLRLDLPQTQCQGLTRSLEYYGTTGNYKILLLLANFFHLQAPLFARSNGFLQFQTVASTCNNMIFHAEFFYDSNTDDMIFCEVAGRSGGGCGIVVQSIFDTYGINLTREYIMLESVPDYKISQPKMRKDQKVASYLMIPNPRQAQTNTKLLSQIEITYMLDGTNGQNGNFSSIDGVKLVFLSQLNERSFLLEKLKQELFLP
jgi:hypothetical protein